MEDAREESRETIVEAPLESGVKDHPFEVTGRKAVAVHRSTDNDDDKDEDDPELTETPTVTNPTSMDNNTSVSTTIINATMNEAKEEPTATRNTVISTTMNATPSVLENAKMEVHEMIEKKEFGDDTNSVSAIQTLFRENEAMKEKVTKLKTLLGRSAKAQRDTKVEMEQWQKRYDALQKENTKLQSRIHQLSARPTHLDLLADFETNFDRALLSVVHQGNQYHHPYNSNNQPSQKQSGGQDTSGTTTTTTTSSLDVSEKGGAINVIGGDSNTSIHNTNRNGIVTHSANAMDHILMQELSDAKKRIETLEQYNATLVQRCTQLENQYTGSKHTITELVQKISHIELEKKIAQMEVDQMTKQLQYNQSSLDEMQLEIELLSKKSTIQQTAAHRREVLESDRNRTGHRSDPELIQHLQEQVQALEEWAIASNHAKTIANDRIRLLEQQLLVATKQHSIDPTTSIITDVSTRSTGSSCMPDVRTSDANRNDTMNDVNRSNNNNNSEWVLDTRKASLVIGAGDVGIVVFELNQDQLKSVNTFTQRIALRWRFDILQGPDSDITFSILKGQCTTASERRNADTMIQNRMVQGGAGGEMDANAFSIQRSCTVVWSNQHSWIRPRTIKYILEAIVMDD